MKKVVAVGVIVLFIGLAFAPSINANVSKESELVEIATEVCGLNGGKHTVSLSKEDAIEVEKLIDDIERSLDKVKTREETVEIFNEAIVELDKYGLLGGLSVKQAQRLVAGRYQNSRMMAILEKLFCVKQSDWDVKNSYCLLIADVDGSVEINWFFLFFLFFEIYLDIIGLPGKLFDAFVDITIFYTQAKLIRFLAPWIMLGDNIYCFSIGLKGIVREPFIAFLGYTGLRISLTFDELVPIRSIYIGISGLLY